MCILVFLLLLYTWFSVSDCHIWSLFVITSLSICPPGFPLFSARSLLHSCGSPVVSTWAVSLILYLQFSSSVWLIHLSFYHLSKLQLSIFGSSSTFSSTMKHDTDIITKRTEHQNTINGKEAQVKSRRQLHSIIFIISTLGLLHHKADLCPLWLPSFPQQSKAKRPSTPPTQLWAAHTSDYSTHLWDCTKVAAKHIM